VSVKRLVPILGLTVAVAVVIAAHGTSVHAKVIETLDDACSGDVVVKVPYPKDNEPNPSSLDGNDIVLARSKTYCGYVEGTPGSPPTHKGVCQHNPTKKSSLTDKIKYSAIRNSERRFRWFCGKTAERSRCVEGTKFVRFRIGPDRLFETLCLDE
jgi:hypothetical protein